MAALSGHTLRTLVTEASLKLTNALAHDGRDNVKGDGAQRSATENLGSGLWTTIARHDRGDKCEDLVAERINADDLDVR